jgi:CheY-like chemotaxis protein
MNAKYTVMIVEDNPLNIKLAVDLLEMEGFIVQKCFNAESALELLKGPLPDIILADIALPGMDGLELVRKLRSEERTKRLKIVALTAFAMKGDQERAFEAGCNGYITKPIETRKFGNQILTILTSE